MSIRIYRILPVFSLIVILAWYFGLRPEPSGTPALSLALSSTEYCQPNIGSQYIQKLSSATAEANRAALTLLDLAKQSPECRDVVINEVIGALNKADLENDNSAFQLWAKGSTILGRLKAVESLDLLISHLDLSDGLFSASMVHEPVVLAMLEMGEPAVPKLAFALKHNPNKRIRLAAAYCLGDIGGSEAVDAMKSALSSETVECVRRFIRLTLPTETANTKRPITAADGELVRQRILAYTCSN